MSTSSLIGMQIDQYLIEAYIARGGMAEVYLATDVMLQRKVALKVMLSELAVDQTATARFQREAEAVARLNHPNIIQIYTTGVTPDKRRYLAMQYVPGGTLQQKLAELSRHGQQMSVGDSLYLGRQVAAALQVAHAHEIVHRDLKPSNILLRSDGEPVLTDLGIAAMETEASRLTRTGNVMGTPHYMSPEQALGKNVDGRSDIYSLGIILYELLSGQVPFAGDSPLAVLHQHVHEPPRSLIQVRPGLSRSTYQTVDTCLQKEPERRFQTAQQLAAALDHSLMSEGLITPQAVTTYPTVKIPDQRRRWPLWTVAVLVMLFAAIAVGYLVAKPGDPQQREESERLRALLPTIAVTTPNQPDEATATFVSTAVTVPTETALFDPGCFQGQENTAYIDENGDLCFGKTKILDSELEAGGCFEIGEIAYSFTREHFAVVLRCFEGDNDAFVFRANGSDKKRLTGEWDYINYDQYTWTADGYFVYQRINSCCVEPSPDAPPEGVVWYNPLTDRKQIFTSPSPLEQYKVGGVASDDQLNIRASAGAENSIVGSIPYNGSGIIVTGLATQVDGDQWVPIRYHDLTGWVNSSYIQKQSSETSPAAPLITSDVTAAFLASAPLIDGSLTDWPGDPSYLSAHLVYQDDTWDGTDDVEAVWQLGWDDAYLYAAVSVEDNVHVQTASDIKIWQGDSVEIQFDADLQGDFGTTLSTDDYQLNVSPGDFGTVPPAHHFWQSSAGGRYQWIGDNEIVTAAREMSEGGYVLEMAIPWNELALSPIPGLKIGIALNVSDNDSPGTAVQEVMKSSSQDRNFTHPDTWGTLTLRE